MPRQNANLIDAYLKVSKGNESTDRIRKWCAISIIAATIERKLWIKRGRYTLFPNLYIFIIANSGFVKKSTSTAIAVNLLRNVKQVRIMSERLTAASLIQQLNGSGKVFEFEGRKICQSPVYIYASELAVFLTEVFGSITELLTTFYDCQPTGPDNDSTSAWVNNTISGGERPIHGPCLNMLGASTPAWLRKCIPLSEIEGGFTSRVIFVVERGLPDKLIAWPELDYDSEVLASRIIDDLRHIYSLKGRFGVTKAGKEVLEDWYENHMKVTIPRQCTNPKMIGYLSRKCDTIIKLAMIHSVACNDTLMIDKFDIGWAEKELSDLEPEWTSAFNTMPQGEVPR